VKLGGNWVTKREWIEEYLQRVRKYKQKINKKNDITAKKSTVYNRSKKKKRRWFSKENLKSLFFHRHKPPSS